MQACSISDPVPLATYSIAASSSEKGLVSVFATHTPVPHKEDGWVTLTAQGDGIHIMDLANSQPVASHTLGPTTMYAAPALTVVTKNRRITYVAIESSPDIKASERGKIVWFWIQELSQKSAGTLERTTVHLSHQIRTIFTSPTGSHLIAISPQNTVTSVTPNFEVISSRDGGASTDSLLQSWIFAQRECTFAPGTDGSVIVRVLSRSGTKTMLVMDICEADGSLSFLTELPLEDVPPTDIVDCSLSPDGHFSLITRSGHWRYYHADLDNIAGVYPQLYLHDAPLALKSLLFSGTSPYSRPTSLLRLNTSQVLLASTSTTDPSELILQIWDLRYSVLLLSYSTSFPSSLLAGDVTTGDIRLSLVDATSGQAVLIMSTPPSSASASKIKARHRSTVVIIPYAAPITSTIANAMNRSSITVTSKWLASASPLMLNTSQIVAGPDAPNALSLPQDISGKDVLLKEMTRTVASGQFDDTERAFNAWVREETERLTEAAAKARDVEQDLNVSMDDATLTGNGINASTDPLGAPSRDIDIISLLPSTAKKQPKKALPMNPVEDRINLSAQLSHSFVGSVLKIVLEGQRGSASVDKIVNTLLYYRAVTHHMIPTEGGLLRRLAERSDWDTIMTVLLVVPDIPEEELVRLLKLVIQAEIPQQTLEAAQGKKHRCWGRQRYPPTSNGTPISSQSTKPPRLPEVLAALLAYPTSPAAMRVALRSHLSDVRDLLPVIYILEGWTEAYADMGWEDITKKIKSKSSSKKALGEPPAGGFHVAKLRPHQADRLPPFESILVFLQSLLDTSFLALIQHTPAHSLLLNLANVVTPQVEFHVNLEKLRGPLEPFARAAALAIQKKSKDPKREQGPTPAVTSAKVAKRTTRDPPVVVGLYQLEELVF
ncbi:hypothetical protein BS47DRAFT_1487880 [Hydnum rufescens UP504]|uniref:Uncharacterized protein n=1 Tax=Hydnum rufescens UP504 TaxID=1448309 RepID=A0A9P6DSJ7_9AGAM|nr:hypothetical protein BS47DRAFT_1487880 [Hydnum rufescens UP504]